MTQQIKFSIVFVSIFFIAYCYSDHQTSADETKSPSLESVFQKAGGKINFITGKYDSSKLHEQLKDISGTKSHFLLPEVAKQWNAMSQAFDREKTKDSKQTLFLVSSFRSFDQQKAIWESKYSGQRKMREPVQGKSPEEIVGLILEFSSAPGTSRHHWGTDLDLNALENSYFEKGGKGYEIYNWLTVNANRFGFCQPYNAKALRNNKGYEEEKWHWSYRPISSKLRTLWIEEFKANKLKMEGYKGSEIMNTRALDYVSEVANDCK